MARRVSSSGRPYAQGSHMVRGEYPRECHGCGKPTSLNECWQETINGEKRSWHHECRLNSSQRVPRGERTAS